MRELLGALHVDPRQPAAAARRSPTCRRWSTPCARTGSRRVVLGPERRELLDRMQAFMAVLEGYAEHVMDAVGADVLDDLPALRAALERRRRDRSGLPARARAR